MMQAGFDSTLDDALSLLRAGRIDDAAALCRACLANAPTYVRASELLGRIELLRGDAAAAEARLKAVVAAVPDSFDALRGLAVAQVGLGRPEQAEASFRAAMALRPEDAHVHYDLGVLLLDCGRLDEAAAAMRRALNLAPDLAEAHFNLAVALDESGDHKAAVASYLHALDLQPALVEAHLNLGIGLGKMGRHEAAIAHFQRVIEEKPDMPEAHFNLGVALRCAGYDEAAMTSYRRALELRPDYASAHNAIGLIHLSNERTDDAVACFRKALSAEPDLAEAHANMGMALGGQQDDQPALRHFDQALALDPKNLLALRGLAALHSRTGRLAEAAAALNRAVAQQGSDVGLLVELGEVLDQWRQPEMAAAAYRQALDNNPKWSAAWHGLGRVLPRLGRYGEAMEAYERALAIDPADTMALDRLVSLRRTMCDWRDFTALTDRIAKLVSIGVGGVSPMQFLTVVDDAAAHLACARQFVQWQRVASAPAVRGRRARGSRLKIGYYSADFRQHATSYLITELFEVHDRSRFEIVAVSFGRDDKGPMRERVIKAVDKFIDVERASQAEIARRIEAERIDILIDLDGHTAHNRLAVLARRPAPIQVHYMGYPGSLGVDFIDYQLVDGFVTPADADRHFMEKLVRLPQCYQVSDRRRQAIEPGPSRADCHLPASGFVFCCFNAPHKLTPPMFDVWMRLLAAVPGSVLWLFVEHELAAENLRREAAARGVDPMRLVLATRVPPEAHLARHRLADLFLDTLPYNAHTTTNDSLWAGVPVVTCVGAAFPARVAGSLITTAGLPELITSDLAAYEALALRLASDPAALAEIRAKLRAAITDSPLFDTDAFAAAVEKAYETMWEINERGEPPRAFAV